MVFNGDSENNDICSDIDFWCSTDDTNLPLTEKARLSNLALAKISSRIMRKDRRWKHVSSNATTIPVATMNLVAGQDNYPLETKHLKILRVRIVGKDGVKKTLDPIDRSTATDDVLNATGQPRYYDKIGFSIMPYPVPDYGASAGLEIEYQPGSSVDNFISTDTNKEPGFNPDLHRLVSLYASDDYCSIHDRGRLEAIREKAMELEALLDDYMESRDIDDEPAFSVQKDSRGISFL